MMSKKDHIKKRSEFLKITRDFFEQSGFLEIVPPVLNSSVPNEPELFPFSTVWKSHTEEKKFYLPMSPERSLKLALAENIGNSFAIGHSFRNLEAASSRHTPEFLMLEWYREDATYKDIMQDIHEYYCFLVQRLHPDSKKVCNPNNEWKIISIKDFFENKLQTEYKKIIHDETHMIALAKKLGYSTNGATWRQLFDQIIVNEIEATLTDAPTFIVDFPSIISPLCTPKQPDNYLAERFELYIGKIEIANGNNENLDTNYLRQVFEAESQKSGVPADEEFLEALSKMRDSGKKYAGVGLGIERLMTHLIHDYTLLRV